MASSSSSSSRTYASTLGVLLWKNGKLKLRRPCATLLELVVPLVFVALFAALKTQTGVVKVAPGWSTEITSESQCPFPIPPEGGNRTCRWPNSRYVTPVPFFNPLLAAAVQQEPEARVLLAASSENLVPVAEAFQAFLLGQAG